MIGVLAPAVFWSVADRAAGGPGSAWFELLRYVPYPAFVVAALVALGVSWRLGRGWRLAAAAGLVLVLTVVMGLAVGHADAGTLPVRVMTYNVKAWLAEHRSGGFEPLAREVALQNPDILVMQDAGELAAARATDPTADAIFTDKQVVASGQYIVVSRFPLRDCRPGLIPYRGERHTYLRCTVTPHAIDIDLVTAHLRSPRDGLNATRHERSEGLDEWRQNFEDRLAQATQLAADIAPRTRPLIVAGDLNAPEASPVVQRLLARGLRDAFSSAAFGYGYTHGHALRLRISFLRIDHILVSRDIGVRASHVGGKEASEHRPVIADLLLAPAPS